MDNINKLRTKVKRLERTIQDLNEELDEVFERLRDLEARAEDDDEIFAELDLDWDNE